MNLTYRGGWTGSANLAYQLRHQADWCIQTINSSNISSTIDIYDHLSVYKIVVTADLRVKQFLCAFIVKVRTFSKI